MAHPYKSLPPYSYWSKSVSSLDLLDIDPVTFVPFKIDKNQKVATAGSCFAQHIARYLKLSGFNYYIAENCHPIASSDLAKKFNYGIYSARFGNIYTTRQLLQLFQRAFGEFEPDELAWKINDLNWVDPFRPQIQPNGFRTPLELIGDRKQHFSKIRQMFTDLDIFIFTLGLTECWSSKSDGAVFPICPGVVGGSYDSKKYQFNNFNVVEVELDFQLFLDKLRKINPKAKVILTVSPVPLVATAEERHVIVSTIYSKSVLRVAAENLVKNNEDVTYFPSFEIITGNFTRGKYYAEDLRSVTEAGVEHVMNIFLKHFTVFKSKIECEDILTNSDSSANFLVKMKELVDVNCDELNYDK